MALCEVLSRNEYKKSRLGFLTQPLYLVAVVPAGNRALLRLLRLPGARLAKPSLRQRSGGGHGASCRICVLMYISIYGCIALIWVFKITSPFYFFLWRWRREKAKESSGEEVRHWKSQFLKKEKIRQSEGDDGRLGRGTGGKDRRWHRANTLLVRKSCAGLTPKG